MKSASRARTIFVIAVALALSACGAPRAAQLFIRDHTMCLPAHYGSPAWSVDGSLIYYDVSTGSAPDIHAMHDDGAGDRLLAREAFDPLPSPDGARLLFASQNLAASHNPDGSGKFVYDYFVLDLASLKSGPALATGFAAAWSPDSRWIAYGVGPQNYGPLKKTNVLTGETIPLTEAQEGGSTSDSYPVWSPDGQQIAFTSNRDGRASIYIMAADGSDVARLTGAPDPPCGYPDLDVSGAWFPGGNGLIVTRSCDVSSTLRVIDTSGESPREWDKLGQKIRFDQLSPDGRRVLYSSQDTPGNPTVNVADLDGSNPRLLHLYAWAPRWSPDGRLIVFVGFDGDFLGAIFVINADGSGLTQLTQNPGAGQVCLH